MATGLITGFYLTADLVCLGGAVIGIPPVSTWQLTETIEGFLVHRAGSLTIPMTWDLQSSIVPGTVIRAHHLDGTTEGYDEYRVGAVRRSRRLGLVSVTLRGIEMDLVDRGVLVTDVDEYATPTTILTDRVVAAMPAHWGVGTVTPSAAIAASYSAATPLAVALAVAEAIYTATGSRYEVSARRDGVAGYMVDLTAFGSAVAVADVRSGKNLLDASLTLDDRDQATRLAPTTPGYLSRPTYVISAVVVNTSVDVTEVSGLPSAAREADQWNDYYLHEWRTGTSHLITDTVFVSATTTRFLIASTTGMVVKDLVYLATDAARTDVSQVDSPSLQATYGVILRSITGTDPSANLLRNADYTDWTAGLPVDWSASITAPGAVTESTAAGTWRYGGKSAHIDGNGFTCYLFRTETVYASAATTAVVSAWFDVIALGGAPSSSYIRMTVDGSEVWRRDGSTWVLGWNHIVSDEIALAAGSRALYFETLISGTAEIFLDAGQIVVGGPSSGTTFRPGSGAAANIAAANAYFDAKGTPVPTYDISVADLALLDQTAWSADAIQVGATVAVTDAVLGLERALLRVVTMDRSNRNPIVPRLSLSTLPKRLTTALAAQAVASSGTTTVVVQGGGGAASPAFPLTADADFAQFQALQFVVENRTSDPGSPVAGQLWLRTDL